MTNTTNPPTDERSLLRDRAALRRIAKTMVNQHNLMVFVLHSYHRALTKINSNIMELNRTRKKHPDDIGACIHELNKTMNYHNRVIHSIRKSARRRDPHMFCRLTRNTGYLMCGSNARRPLFKDIT